MVSAPAAARNSLATCLNPSCSAFFANARYFRIAWLSPALQQRAGLDAACLQRDWAQRRLSHDHYFHSVLGLLDIRTSAYQRTLDAFAPCQSATLPR